MKSGLWSVYGPTCAVGGGGGGGARVTDLPHPTLFPPQTVRIETTTETSQQPRILSLLFFFCKLQPNCMGVRRDIVENEQNLQVFGDNKKY
jgi:hypothetical protein